MTCVEKSVIFFCVVVFAVWEGRIEIGKKKNEIEKEMIGRVVIY